MNKKKYSVRLDFIKLPSSLDFNEIVLRVKGKKIFPVDEKYFKIKDEVIIPLNIEFGIEAYPKQILVELWEYKYFLPDDYIGLFKLENFQNDMCQEAVMTNNSFGSMKVSLVWSVTQLENEVHRETANQMS
jgi:hypothetical protein